MKPQELISVGRINPFVKAAITFADDDKRTLFFAGLVGCGKTHAAIVAQTVHPEPGELITAFGLSRMAPWDNAIDRITACQGVLVIDDVGTEFETKPGKFLALLDAVINERDRAARKTVITSNYPIDIFRNRYGNRILDRIRGSGLAIESKTQSLRGRDLGSVSIWRYPLKPDRETLNRAMETEDREAGRAKVVELSRALVKRLTRSSAPQEKRA